MRRAAGTRFQRYTPLISLFLSTAAFVLTLVVIIPGAKKGSPENFHLLMVWALVLRCPFFLIFLLLKEMRIMTCHSWILRTLVPILFNSRPSQHKPQPYNMLPVKRINYRMSLRRCAAPLMRLVRQAPRIVQTRRILGRAQVLRRLQATCPRRQPLRSQFVRIPAQQGIFWQALSRASPQESKAI